MMDATIIFIESMFFSRDIVSNVKSFMNCLISSFNIRGGHIPIMIPLGNPSPFIRNASPSQSVCMLCCVPMLR